MLYNVKADHPILKRIDEYGLTENEVDKLVIELIKLNYENIDIQESNKK